MTLLETTNEGAAEPVRLTTPLGQAIGNLFARALPLLDGNPPGSLKVFVFGGCAVHLLTHARGSADIDAEIEAARVLRKDEIMAVYTPRTATAATCRCTWTRTTPMPSGHCTRTTASAPSRWRVSRVSSRCISSLPPAWIWPSPSSAALRKTINMISNSSSNVAVSMSASLLHWQQRQSIMPWATEAQC